jgi:hypothetical protein
VCVCLDETVRAAVNLGVSCFGTWCIKAVSRLYSLDLFMS